MAGMDPRMPWIAIAACLAGCAGAFAPEPSQRLRGHYTYAADAGVFTDCRSGERMPVLQAGDNAALEAAYVRTRRLAGAPVLATVEGRVEIAPGPDGGPARRSVRVREVLDVAADEGCSGPLADAALHNTYWKLVALGGVPVAVAAGPQREPHLVLQPGRRVGGSSGCNRLAGGYAVEGDRLRFTQLAGTRMACAQGAALERDFLAALERSARWRIAGPWLELAGDDGQPLALFEAVALR